MNRVSWISLAALLLAVLAFAALEVWTEIHASGAYGVVGPSLDAPQCVESCGESVSTVGAPFARVPANRHGVHE